MSRYEIDTDNVVSIWLDDEDPTSPPVIRQPFSPETKQPWFSREEAELWAASACTQREQFTSTPE